MLAQIALGADAAPEGRKPQELTPEVSKAVVESGAFYQRATIELNALLGLVPEPLRSEIAAKIELREIYGRQLASLGAYSPLARKEADRERAAAAREARSRGDNPAEIALRAAIRIEARNGGGLRPKKLSEAIVGPVNERLDKAGFEPTSAKTIERRLKDGL